MGDIRYFHFNMIQVNIVCRYHLLNDCMHECIPYYISIINEKGVLLTNTHMYKGYMVVLDSILNQYPHCTTHPLFIVTKPQSIYYL